MRDTVGWRGVARWRHFDAERRPLAAGEDSNVLTLEGANSILGVYFKGVTQIGGGAWYAALYTATPGASFTGAAATANEQTGSGYARVNVPAWTLYQFGGLWRVTTPVLQFSATGAWTTVTALGFVNASSGAAGKALSAVALTAPRTLANGDFLQVIYAIQLS